MEITTLIGILFGFFCIIFSIVIDNGNVLEFVHGPSMLIVFGGIIAATVVSFPLSTLKSVGAYISQTFKSRNVNLAADVEMIISIANVARREGILALEESLGPDTDPFMKRGIMLIIDGSDPELVRSIMETELDFIADRHGAGIAVLESMSSYAPGFGMIGTLIGLINMLKELDDPDALGPGMSTALITTFYGSLLANLIFTPMSKKLKYMHDVEYLRKQLILEGILSIQDGENPRIIREKLNAFLSATQIKKAMTAKQEPGEN